jgi:hypothetical protein
MMASLSKQVSDVLPFALGAVVSGQKNDNHAVSGVSRSIRQEAAVPVAGAARSQST